MADENEEAAANGGVTTSQPGAVISPGGQTAGPAVTAAPAATPVTTPDPAPPAVQVGGSGSEAAALPELEMGAPDDAEISWTASEFIAHEKTSGWYVMLAVAAVVLAVIIYFLTKDVVSSGVIIIAAIFLAIYGSHKPREMQYHLTSQGIQVGKQLYPYHDFRTFSVVPEGAFSSIVFMPLKRFALPLTIYYDPNDEDKIVDLLASILPLENRRPDMVDSLMRRIRF